MAAHFVCDANVAYSQSCEVSKWVEHEQTQVVQTCWATMALMYAKYPEPEPIERAVRLVMSRQQPVRYFVSVLRSVGLLKCLKDGSWAQEAIEGVFNKNVAIAYPNFKFSFTIWMLGRAHHYLEELKARQKAGTNGTANGHTPRQ